MSIITLFSVPPLQSYRWVITQGPLAEIPFLGGTSCRNRFWSWGTGHWAREVAGSQVREMKHVWSESVDLMIPVVSDPVAG